MSAVDVESIQPEIASKLVLETPSEEKEAVAGEAKVDASESGESNSNKQKKKLSKLAGNKLFLNF
jgi:hypothetical protein